MESRKYLEKAVSLIACIKRVSFVSYGVLGVVLFALIIAPNIAKALYVPELESNDTHLTAQDLDPHFSYGTNTLIEMDGGGTLAAFSASVYGFSGDYTYDYFSFTVGTGSTPLTLSTPVAFDTDFAEINGLDTVLALFDTDGTTVLASNDDTPFDGPGDMIGGSFNSFMTYTFTSPGVYFIRVGEFDPLSPLGDVLYTDATYHLHVSSVPEPTTLLLLGLGGLMIRKRRRSF